MRAVSIITKESKESGYRGDAIIEQELHSRSLPYIPPIAFVNRPQFGLMFPLCISGLLLFLTENNSHFTLMSQNFETKSKLTPAHPPSHAVPTNINIKWELLPPGGGPALSV